MYRINMNIKKIKEKYIVNLSIILMQYDNKGRSKICNKSTLLLDNNINLPKLMFTYIANMIKDRCWDMPGVFSAFKNKIEIGFDTFCISILADDETFDFEEYYTELFNEFEYIRYY